MHLNWEGRITAYKVYYTQQKDGEYMNIEIHEMVYCKKLKKRVDWRCVCNSIQERCVFFGGIDRLGLECNYSKLYIEDCINAIKRLDKELEEVDSL